ncbi:MAG: hypothetical protein JNJ57_03265, partial [Saprospiraceae bacterium]|nr:hypothetical protein [Saprospiraceae bacterium]
MKQLFILLIFFTPFGATAQTGKFKFGVALTPGFSTNIVTGKGFGPDIYRERETGIFAFFGQVFAEWKVKKRSFLNAGFGYSQSGYKNISDDLIFGNPEPNAPTKVKFISLYHDILLPFTYRYHFSPKKTS